MLVIWWKSPFGTIGHSTPLENELGIALLHRVRQYDTGVRYWLEGQNPTGTLC